MRVFHFLRAGALCLGLAPYLSGIAHAAEVQAASQDLVQRYDESLRRATQDNDFSGAIRELGDAIEEYRDIDPENPQLAALFLLRGVLQFSTYGEDARDEILDSFEAALRVHPWAQIEPSMRSERLDELLQAAQERVNRQPPTSGHRSGASPLRCQADTVIYAAYSGELGVASATLHWKSATDPEFRTRPMDLFAGVVASRISVQDHQDQDGEYFIVLQDANGEQLASIGSPSSPQRLRSDCAQAASQVKRRVYSRASRDMLGPGEDSSSRNRRFGVRLMVGTGWGVSYGESQRVYDIANPNKPGHYSLLATACAIARRAAPRGGPLPDAQALHGGNVAAPSADSIFGSIAVDPAQAAQLASVYDAKRCAQRHPINGGVASSFLHIEPEFSVRISDRWEAALFSRLQLLSGINLLAPVEGAPIDAIDPAFEPLSLPMPWTVGLKARYRKEVPRVQGLSWYVGGYAGYGRAALAVPMPFGHDRNGNSVADENEVGCSVAPGRAPVFPAMDGCSDSTQSGAAIEALKAKASGGDKARDVLELGQAFAGVELGVEYMFTPVIGVSAASQVGVWFAGRRTSGLLDLKLGPSLRF